MSFKVSPLTPNHIQQMKDTGVWKDGCPIPLNRLREVSIEHYTFEGLIQQGSIVVLDVVAPYVEEIFRDLFEQKFPLHRVTPIEAYGGDDDSSMEENNSSAFNYRPIAGTNILSLHSYGVAIDINPCQNPFIKNAAVHPAKKCSLVEVWPTPAHSFLNRTNLRPGMVEPLVGIFHQFGFRSWGGHWDNPIDIHHFEVYRNITEFLAVTSPGTGEKFFELYLGQSGGLEDIDFLSLAEKNIEKVWDILENPHDH